MSKYYNIDKPFSIKNWNSLIQDVNDILENPPSGCSAVDPLDDVTDPHLWAVKDIKGVRDALIKTCPDISFNEELKLWKSGIVDEIESEMKKAWCNCAEQNPEIKIWGTGYFTPEEWGETPIRCCGNIVDQGVSHFCNIGGPGQQNQYSGVYLPPVSDPPSALATSLYAQALAAVGNWNLAWLNCVQAARNMDYYQNLIDAAVVKIDGYISQWNAVPCSSPPPVNPCSALCTKMHQQGAYARSWQSQLDNQHATFILNNVKIDPYLQQANNFSIQNWVLFLGLSNRWPSGHVWVKESASAISNNINKYAWGKWFNPYTDRMPTQMGDYLADTMADLDNDGHISINTLLFKFRNGVGTENGFGSIKLTPSGKPYMTGGIMFSQIREYAETYYWYSNRWLCDKPAGDCPPPHAALRCEWSEWSDPVRIYWAAGTWGNPYAGWLYAPLPAPGEPGMKIWTPPVYETYKWSILKPPREMKDHTEDQDSFRKLYGTDWYTEHPKYDDRDQSTC